MKIGVISDIHGNHYALEAVLEEAKLRGINKFIVLGDIVGYYYHPDIVLELLSNWRCEIIKGNHEVILHQLYENRIDSNANEKKYGRGHEIALAKLDTMTLNCLFSLEVQKSVKIDNISIQLNHGSPWSIDQYLYPDTEVEILDGCNSATDDFVLIGHSHYQFAHQCSNSILINCGSVGQSRQKGGVSNWAVIDTVDKSYALLSTKYNTTELLKEVESIDGKSTYSYEVLKR